MLLIRFRRHLSVSMYLSHAYFRLRVGLTNARFLARFFVLVSIILNLGLSSIIRRDRFVRDGTIILVTRTVTHVVTVNGSVYLGRFSIVLLTICRVRFPLVRPMFRINLIKLPLRSISSTLRNVNLVLLCLGLRFREVLIAISKRCILGVYSGLITIRSSFVLMSQDAT